MSFVSTKDFGMLQSMKYVVLPCEKEPGNSHNTFAIVVRKPSPSGNVTVRHTLLIVSVDLAR